MELLYFFENIRTPVGDVLFQLITLFGEETLFLVLALILFWCIDKKKAYYIMICGFIATLTGQFLKLVCRIDRPWVRDPEFTIVESAREAATGYSFPSGHTLIVTSTWGSIARCFRKNALRILSAVLILLVGISRMYLGVHTPWDVLFGWGFGLVTVFALYPLLQKAVNDARVMWGVIGGLCVLSLAYLLYVSLASFPADIDAENLDSALKNAWTLFGLTVGLAVAFFVDSRFTNFDTKAVWWAQILKVAGGLVVLLLVKTLLKQPLLALTDGHHLADGIRYFLVVVVAGAVWPLTFPFFGRLGRKST